MKKSHQLKISFSIGSGDSDFLEVRKFTMECKKKFLVLCFEKGVSWEMRKGHHLFLEEIREEIEQKKPQPEGQGVNN